MADAALVEPGWLQVNQFPVGSHRLGRRILQLTDIHFTGDRDYFQSVVLRVNELNPDIVCFTGDLIEEADQLEPALAILRQIRAPIFGIPGNHDHWSGADLSRCAEVLKQQGGAWLEDAAVDLFDGRLRLLGVDRMPIQPKTRPGAFNLLMIHYPEWADQTQGQRYDLVLAGHTHGGQVRLPWIGAIMTPFLTGGYEKGWFKTAAGPLYVNPGIGYFYINVRFNCRPELTLFEI